MDDKHAQFLPFHAINEFMVPEYRLNVIQTVFADLEKLSRERRNNINSHIKKAVQVPGFRNSLLAPTPIKARSAVGAFERRPDFVANVLQAWTELKPELRQKVYDFLTAREWAILPAEADRTKMPGFIPEWPKGQDYDVLGQAYDEMYPGDQPNENDLRLMIVWLANRLPFDMYEDEAEEGEEEVSE